MGLPEASDPSPLPGEAQRLRVVSDSRSYDIVLGRGVFDDANSYADLAQDAAITIISNTTVAPMYAGRLAACLRAGGRQVACAILEDGEAHKTWASVERIVDALLQAGADRHSTLIALGGGVVGDVTGFAAACYMRGIDYVQVPTTLLAQVDSSVGGKTAINHALGKNMIGAFHQPRLVVADLDTLDSLPERELVAGLAEVIKSAAVADATFFGWIEANLEALLRRDKVALAHAVRRSCEIKAAIVAADEKESGLRVVLNFGHTFGHAIESGAGYGVWLHGEAVGCGMVMAAEVSRRLGMIDGTVADRVAELVRRSGLPLRAPTLGAERYLDLMRVDKKSRGGNIRLVLLERLGAARLEVVDTGLIAAVIAEHERPAGL